MKSIITLTLMAWLSVFACFTTAFAQVTGNCGHCHTMHNSQGGSHMILNTDIDGTSGGTHGGGFPALTRGTCVGCHTGSNNGSNTTPYVYNTGSVTYGTDTLAGGNFKWVVTDDAKGHNVKGIPSMTADALLSIAPGGLISGSGCSCHESLYTTTAIDTGCEGCHREPKHHAPQQDSGTAATVDNGYFRFLSGHMTNAGEGVHGIEDPDWQYTNSPTDHNEYLGNISSGNTDNTMSRYCIGCHGEFHTQKSGDSWIRHPSDAVLPNSGEYTGYTVYDPNVPVARVNLTTITDTASVANNSDMVMCLSCHRAHGSPYNDMLRWNYDGMIAGGGTGCNTGNGCFRCHSEKD